MSELPPDDSSIAAAGAARTAENGGTTTVPTDVATYGCPGESGTQGRDGWNDPGWAQAARTAENGGTTTVPTDVATYGCPGESARRAATAGTIRDGRKLRATTTLLARAGSVWSK